MVTAGNARLSPQHQQAMQAQVRAMQAAQQAQAQAMAHGQAQQAQPAQANSHLSPTMAYTRSSSSPSISQASPVPPSQPPADTSAPPNGSGTPRPSSTQPHPAHAQMPNNMPRPVQAMPYYANMNISGQQTMDQAQAMRLQSMIQVSSPLP